MLKRRNTAILAVSLWHGHLGRVFTGWKPVPHFGRVAVKDLEQWLKAIEQKLSELKYQPQRLFLNITAPRPSSKSVSQKSDVQFKKRKINSAFATFVSKSV